MSEPVCQTIPLEDLFNEDCSPAKQKELERHLDRCTGCQDRLEALAAEHELWTQAATCLSTVEDISLPNHISDQLRSSSLFVVPTLDQPSDSASTVQPVSNDWTKILDPPSHPETLGRIDQFEIESKLGQGGMGIVLKGFDRGLNRAVAIKILAPYLAANGTARRRFAREAQAAAAVVHPNVVRIYSVNKSPDRPYLVMELGPSHTLQSLVKEHGPLDPADVVRIAIQISSGLAAAHKIGLIHRDVKPGNILVEGDVSRVMITDFGLARAANDAGMTQTGWLAGTPHYMSPEQGKGDDLDRRSDLFSLGSLLYFLATGREPFRAEKPYAVIQKIINERPANPTDANSDVPVILADIIEKLLEKDPKNRFGSANELAEVLEQYLAHLQQPRKAKPPKRILTQRRKRSRWLIGLVASAAIIGIGVAAWISNPWSAISNKTGATSAKGQTTSSVSSPAEADPMSNPAPATNALPVEHVPKGDGMQPGNSQPPVLQPNIESNLNEPLPSGFAFDDDAFASEIRQLDRDLNAFEQSLKTTSPTSQGFETPNLELQLLETSRLMSEGEDSVDSMLEIPSRAEQPIGPAPADTNEPMEQNNKLPLQKRDDDEN